MGKQSRYTQLDSGERALLALVGKSLFGGECALSEEEQLAALEESKKQAVYCLAAQSVSLKGEAFDRVRNMSLASIRKNVEILLQHQYLHELMTEAGIPYVILKGAASAYYYPQPQQRMMGDVDFLVAAEDVERAAKLLKEEGFIPGDESHCHHIAFSKGHAHFELHFDPPGIPPGEVGEIIRGYLHDIISTARTVQNGVAVFQNPEPFYHGLVMLLHMKNHLLVEGIGLRHLCDWAVFVDRYSDSEFREMYEEKLKRVGLWTFAVAISQAAHLAISLPYRDFMGQDTDLAYGLLMDILSGGNFGRKKKGRAAEAIFIASRSREGIKHSRPVQMIITVNQIIYSRWPISKKVKLFLPFGWLYFGGLRVFRVIKGTREPLQLARAYRDSQPRKELYRQLHLFETGEF